MLYCNTALIYCLNSHWDLTVLESVPDFVLFVQIYQIRCLQCGVWSNGKSVYFEVFVFEQLCLCLMIKTETTFLEPFDFNSSDWYIVDSISWLTPTVFFFFYCAVVLKPASVPKNHQTWWFKRNICTNIWGNYDMCQWCKNKYCFWQPWAAGSF